MQAGEQGTRHGDASGLQYSALARGTHRARTRGAEKVHAALKNGQKRDFWPFNGQFLGIETIDPPFLLARSGPTVAAHPLVKPPQNVTDRKETSFSNYGYRCQQLNRKQESLHRATDRTTPSFDNTDTRNLQLSVAAVAMMEFGNSI